MSEPTIFIASKIKDGEVWLPRFLIQLEQLEIPDSKIAFMYSKSPDKTFSYLDHYRRISRHNVSLYADPYIPPEERHGAMLTRVKQDIQKLLDESGCEYYLNIDCDIVDVPKDIVTKLLENDKDVCAPMVWTEGRNPPVFFDSYEFRMDGFRFHPLNPPGMHKTEPFMVDSVSTFYLATADAELTGEYKNPYPHIPWSKSLIEKGYEIWVDPRLHVWHIDLEDLGIGRQPLPVPTSFTPFKTDDGRIYSPQQVGAQLYNLAIYTHHQWLLNHKPASLKIMNAFLKSRPLITASYKVFNSDDYLEQSLESVYPYVDAIDIVEGAINLRKGEGNFSTDNTLEIIKTFPDPDNKIRLIQGRFKDKQEIQQKLLEVCRSKWMLFIDADEIVEGMELVRQFAEKNPDGKMVYARPERFINFIHDFEHIIYSVNPMSPWSQTGLPHPFLIHHDIPGLNFGQFHTVPMDGFQIPIHSDSHEYRGRRDVLDDVIVYHFGNVLSEEKLFNKLNFEKQRGIGWNKCDEVKDNFMFSGVLPEDMIIESFDKEKLPEIMQHHALFHSKPKIEHWTEEEIIHFKFI